MVSVHIYINVFGKTLILTCKGNFHGGAIATVIDLVSSLALAPLSKPGQFVMLGVTRSLQITYISSASAGDVVLLDNEVISFGRRLACIRTTVRNKATGKTVAYSLHDKVNTDKVMTNL